MKQTRTRFAPSPTGYMHIGNLRTALYEYLIAKKDNGKFILRIEDTDQERFVEGAVDVIYKTLKLAGMNHDEGPDIGGEYGPYVQSERKGMYLEYAKKLVDLGGAYYCFCTKERLAALKEEHEAKGEQNRYDRCCMKLSKEEVESKLAAGTPYIIRQKMPDTGSTSFDDAVYGTITVENSELDDQILIKTDGMPTYNFANVIDDHTMAITHVVRGNEYLASTPKYNLLYKAFGWDIPTYVHVPLILKGSGQKLSKRAGDPSFEDLVAMGYLVEAIVNYVVLLGWSPSSNQEIFSLAELEQIFDIDGISKSPAIFDIQKLTWMNGEYIKKLPVEEFDAMAKPYYEKAQLSNSIDTMKLSKLLQMRTEVLTSIPEAVDFINELPDYDLQMFVHKKSKTTLENSFEALKGLLPVIEAMDNWNETSIHDTVFAHIEALGVKNSLILWPLRTAVSGKAVTPGGAIEIADILGKQESIRRINIAIERLEKELSANG